MANSEIIAQLYDIPELYYWEARRYFELALSETRNTTPIPDETSSSSTIVYSGSGGTEGLYNNLASTLSPYSITGVKWNVVRGFIYGGLKPNLDGLFTNYSYDSEGNLNSVIVYDSDKTTKIVEKTLTFAFENLSYVDVKIYDSLGTTVVLQYSDSFAYVNNNLLFAPGDCENVSLWTALNATLTLDSTNKVQGTYSIKVTQTAGTYGRMYYNIFSILDPTKYYFISGWLKNATATNCIIRVYTNGTGGTVKNSSAVAGTAAFENVGTTFTPTDWGTGYTYLFLTGDAVTSAGGYGYFDSIKIWEITSDDATLTETQLLEKYPNTTTTQTGDLKYVTRTVII